MVRFATKYEIVRKYERLNPHFRSGFPIGSGMTDSYFGQSFELLQ